MASPEILGAAAFRRLLFAVYDHTPQHVIGVTRSTAEAALQNGHLQEGWTITFHDEDDMAYCLGEIAAGRIVVKYKTYAVLNEELDS